jgi:DNA-directed RNA polymerase subunit F
VVTLKLLSEKAIAMADVHAILEKRHKESGEQFSYEQQNTLDYSAKFIERLTPAKAKELRKDLEDLKFLTDAQITSLLDILPRKEDVVKAILTGEKLELSEEQVKEVAKTVKKYLKA